MNIKNRVAVGATVDKELWRKLKSQAALEGISAGQLLDKVIKQYLQSKERQHNEHS